MDSFSNKVLPFHCRQHSYVNTGQKKKKPRRCYFFDIIISDRVMLQNLCEFFFTFNDKNVNTELYLRGNRKYYADIPHVAVQSLLHNVILFYLHSAIESIMYVLTKPVSCRNY